VIVQIVLNWFSNMITSLLNAIPSYPASVLSSLADFPGKVNSVATGMSVFSPLIPFDQAGLCIAVIFAVFVAVAGIVLIQRIISLATMGGGSAP